MSHARGAPSTDFAKRVDPKTVKRPAAPTKQQQKRVQVDAARAKLHAAARRFEEKRLRDFLLEFTKMQTGLTDAQLASFQGPEATTDLQARASLHDVADPLVAQHVRLHGTSVDSLLEGAVMKTVRFLSAGAWGVTATAVIPSFTLPVVLKFAALKLHTCCVPELPLVCALPASKSGVLACSSIFDMSPKWVLWWGGGDSADRELAIYAALSRMEHDGVSPHFVHSYLGAAVPLQTPTTLPEVGAWLKAPAKKIEVFPTAIVKTIAVNVLEFGGVIFGDFMQKIMPYVSASQSLPALRSCLMQIFQGLLAMVSEPTMMRHNDCHIDNVLAAHTPVSYLNYQVVAFDGPARETVKWVRYFRVPTFGILCRIMDFGMSTSLEFGRRDHGTMARFSQGGPLWALRGDSLLANLPLEAFDAARIFENVLAVLPIFIDATVDKTLRAEISALVKAVCAQSRAVPTTKPIKAVHKYANPPRVQEINTPDKLRKAQQQVDELEAAMEDHGVMTALFVTAAEMWGFECAGSEPCAGTFDEKTTYIIEAIAPP
jgi:hypothetical protein